MTFILTDQSIQKATKILNKSILKKKERTRISKYQQKNAFSGISFMILQKN